MRAHPWEMSCARQKSVSPSRQVRRGILGSSKYACGGEREHRGEEIGLGEIMAAH